MTNIIHTLPWLRLSLLTLSISLAQSQYAFAMQAISEHELSQVDGQDGIKIATTFDDIKVAKAYWQDQAGMADGTEQPIRAYMNDISVTGNNLGVTMQLNTGTTSSNTTGLDFALDANFGTFKANQFVMCDISGSICSDNMGSLAIQFTKNSSFSLSTTNGLFDNSSMANMTIGLRGLNIYLSQKQNDSVNNQLILKDFNFDFTGKGNIYVDPVGGLVLRTGSTGYVTINRNCVLGADCSAGMTSANSKPGLNIDFVMKGNSGSLNSTPNLSGTKGMIRLGASGYATNSQLSFRGTDARNTANSILGKAFSVGNTSNVADASSVDIMGSSGLVTRLQTSFSNDNNIPAGQSASTLELAHGGDTAYGLSFSNFTPLLVRKQNNGGSLNTDLPYFDSGNVYVNMANTKRISLPQNETLMNAPFGVNGKLTEPSDYLQTIHNLTAANPNALIIAARGTDFQALSRRTEFIASPDVVGADRPTAGGSWGLGLPFYNLNTNLALYGLNSGQNKEQLGFALGMTTQGVNKTALSDGSPAGSKTTSILLLDGKKYGQTLGADGLRVSDPVKGDPINYYIGLRNIDMLLSAYGVITLDNGNLNFTLPQFNIAASADVAVGYLPGSQYRSSLSQYAPIDGFLSKRDVLFGLKLRFSGDASVVMIPGGNTLASNYIQFTGGNTGLNLTNGAIQLIEPVDGSIVGFDNLVGRVNFNNDIKINKDSVNFNNKFMVNPQSLTSEVLRIQNFNLYPSTNAVTGTVGPAQRLGEMVMTGGTITSRLNIIPH